MSVGQLVTAADLEPAGWVCEGCGHEFEIGDQAFGVPEAMTSDGTPIEGLWRCVFCWVARS